MDEIISTWNSMLSLRTSYYKAPYNQHPIDVNITS